MTDAQKALAEFNDYDAGVISFSSLSRECKETIRTALQRAEKVESLVKALREVRDAIKTLPDDCFGYVENIDGEFPTVWPVKLELEDKIEKELAAFGDGK